MLVAGIDVGTRNVSAVILRDSDFLSSCVLTSGEEGDTVSRRAVDRALRTTDFGFADLQYVVTLRDAAEIACPSPIARVRR